MSTAPAPHPDETHALLVNLGKGNPKLPPPGYEQTIYRFPDGVEVETNLAGLALWRWLELTGRAPREVVFACTADAWRDSHASVESEIARLGLPRDRLAAPVELDLPMTQSEVWRLFPPVEAWLRRLEGATRSHVVLHMDLTHGFRAIPIAHTWMGLYLVRRGLAIPGVWGYGVFVPGTTPTPYLDLSHLLDLAEWAGAVEAFQARLDATRLSQLLDRIEDEARRRAYTGGAVSSTLREAHTMLAKLVGAGQAAARFFPAGLPLELGVETGRSLHGITRADVGGAAAAVFPEHARLFVDLFDALAPIAAETSAKRSKEQMLLTPAEIDRQLALVRHWLDAGALGNAVRALRELMVNCVLLAWRSAPGQWLERGWREKAERALSALGRDDATAQRGGRSQALGALWEQVCAMRNAYAHCGMKSQTTDPTSEAKRARQLCDRVAALLGNDELWGLQAGSGAEWKGESCDAER